MKYPRYLTAFGLTLIAVLFQATVGISQTAPGTFTNPIKGGATLLQFSRSGVGATLTGGRVVYYECGAMETQLHTSRVLNAPLNAFVCDELSEMKCSVSGNWNQWIRVSPGANGFKYQGLHNATLNLLDSGGAVLGTLDCRGSNGVGTHRTPLAETAEQCAQPLHFEGSFSGQIVAGVYKGAFLQGTYAGDFTSDPVQSEQGQPIEIVFEGILLKPCPQRYTGGNAPSLKGALEALKLPAAK